MDRQYQAETRRASHAAIFRDQHEFERFLDVDDLRFQYALVYVDVRRAFDELIELDA